MSREGRDEATQAKIDQLKLDLLRDALAHAKHRYQKLQEAGEGAVKGFEIADAAFAVKKAECAVRLGELGEFE